MTAGSGLLPDRIRNLIADEIKANAGKPQGIACATVYGIGILADVVGRLDDQVRELRERLSEVESSGIKYCGVFQRAQSYRRGSLVTHDGSAWCAVTDEADGVPGKSDAWQLMVKRGRDGR
jgi:hypothetical protein